MILPVLERDKINYDIPTFTLDVNQVALKDPSAWPAQMSKLIHLEWNYFQDSKVELCVTPETSQEITQGVSPENLGAIAYARFRKSQLFKSRPAGTTLTLSEQDSNTLWLGIRDILYPTVDDSNLSSNQRSDVSQIFFHTVTSGSLANSAYLTIDQNFHNHATELCSELGITILTPNQAWEYFQPKYDFNTPTEKEIKKFFNDQQKLLINKLMAEASE